MKRTDEIMIDIIHSSPLTLSFLLNRKGAL